MAIFHFVFQFLVMFYFLINNVSIKAANLMLGIIQGISRVIMSPAELKM
jgi:hypothetical protein